MREEAEKDMRDWVDQFLEEIDKIEIFFNTKFLEFSQEFDMLQEMYIRKKYGKRAHLYLAQKSF